MFSLRNLPKLGIHFQTHPSSSYCWLYTLLYIYVCVCAYISPWVPRLKYNEFSVKFPVHHFCWFKSYHNMFCFFTSLYPVIPWYSFLPRSYACFVPQLILFITIIASESHIMLIIYICVFCYIPIRSIRIVFSCFNP